MKKQLLLILISAGISIQQSFCQTVLAPGKIAFLGFQSGQSGQQALDRFAFVLLQDVAAGTQIHFTDNAVLVSDPVQFCTNEGTCRWTANTDLPVGTVVILGEDSVANVGIVDGGLAFSQAGDQIIAFQPLAADTIALAGFSSTGWEATCTSTCGGASNNKTCLPSGLIAGVNAIGFNSELNNAFFNFETYSGSIEGLLEELMDPINWTRGDELQTWPAWQLVLVGAQPLVKNSSLEIFPNPAIGPNVVLRNNGEQSSRIQLFTTLGQEGGDFELSAGQARSISIPQKKGVIWVRVISEAGSFVRKLVTNP